MALVLCGLVLGAVLVGPFPLRLETIAELILARLAGREAVADPMLATVLFGVRLPRIAAGLLVGAGLAAAGAADQGLFRNPSVSPDILGVSTGAGLGAVLGIFLSLPLLGIQMLAFIGGLATVALVYLIGASVRGCEPILVLVLAGVVVGALAGSAISLLKVLADPYDQLPAITFWLLGSLASTDAGDILAAAPAVLIGMAPMVLLRFRMNVLSLGDEEASARGLDAVKLRLVVIAAARLMTASVVAISGVIGWVGLIMPHIARMLVGPNFERLLRRLSPDRRHARPHHGRDRDPARHPDRAARRAVLPLAPGPRPARLGMRLEARSLDVGYPGKPVGRDVSLVVGPRQILWSCGVAVSVEQLRSGQTVCAPDLGPA